jgi:hypothetical protein
MPRHSAGIPQGRIMADLRLILTFEPQGKCFRATRDGRRFILLADRRSGSWSLFEQTPFDEHAGGPGALDARPPVRSRRRGITDDTERRLHGTLRGMGLIGHDDDLERVTSVTPRTKRNKGDSPS